MKLGRYEVVRELGKGAMGIVYLAKDPLIGRLVALKTIRPVAHAEDDETKEFQQRFVREAQAAGILNHPAIVTVFDIGQDDSTGMSFIAMEYVEGQNLKEILAQGRALTFDQIGELIAQVAEALDFAHSKGIVHRDVKPANVIVLEGNRAKIMDFGIAKIATSVANLTTTGQFLGTPNYMAPEQIKGTAVDGRTDIFSLGICLYECLTRRKPFGGDSLTSISYKIVHESFPTLAEINPQIPDGYEEVVARCLAKDPAKRYQRGKDLAVALRAVVRGEKPSQAEPVMAEETIVTRDRLPTLEMPFPEAVEEVGLNTRPSTGAGVTPTPALAAAGGGAVAAARVAAPAKPRVAVGDRMRRTLSDVRAYPLWRQPVPMPMFVILLIMAVGAVIVPIVSIRRQTPAVPRVDHQAAAKTDRERRLRTDGNRLLAQGNVQGAYEKFDQLRKMAPGSPAVAIMVQKLGAITQREELDRQQLAAAKARLDQGIALYNEKKFAEAIPVLQEAFSANPNDDQAANYLKMAQTEQQKVDQARVTAKQARTAAATTTAPRPGTPRPVATTTQPAVTSSAPAQLSTVFNGPFTDGYIMVKVGGDTIAHENVYEERGRAFFRRSYPRAVNVTKELIPRNADVQIWVVVPSKNITEYHVIKHNFLPGSSQKLQVSYNEQSKTFDYQLN